MSRVLVIGINYAPENVGTGKYTAEMCQWLAARGHAVRVITTPPYYPEWKIQPGYTGKIYRREQRNGVDVIRCPLLVNAHPRGVTRMLHLASFGLSSAFALAYSLTWKSDWIVNIAPTLTSAPAALALAKLSGARSWLHIQDFEVDAAIGMRIVDVGPMRRLVLATERTLIRLFDVVSTISPKMINRLADKGVSEERRALFPNWADIHGITPLERPSAYRQELGIPPEAVVAMYSGSMGQKQGLELLSDAARLLADQQNLYFVFGGEGPARSILERACQGLPNVRILDLQPTERLREWLGLADIHLLPQRADVADLVMPSKLTGMLASGRPVLATAHHDTGLASAVRGWGIATPPGETPAFIDALRHLANDAAQRRALGAEARARAEATLSRDAVLGRFEARLSELPN